MYDLSLNLESEFCGEGCFWSITFVLGSYSLLSFGNCSQYFGDWVLLGLEFRFPVYKACIAGFLSSGPGLCILNDVHGDSDTLSSLRTMKNGSKNVDTGRNDYRKNIWADEGTRSQGLAMQCVSWFRKPSGQAWDHGLNPWCNTWLMVCVHWGRKMKRNKKLEG